MTGDARAHKAQVARNQAINLHALAQEAALAGNERRATFLTRRAAMAGKRADSLTNKELHTMTTTETPTEEITESSPVEMLASELARVLGNVVPFTDAKGQRPILSCVRLERTADGITALATDSYQLSWDSDTVDGDPLTVDPVWVRMIDRDTVAMLLKQLKVRAKSYEGTVTLVPGPGTELTAIIGTTTSKIGADPGDFPNYRQLIPASAVACERIAFNPALLAKYAKVADETGYKTTTATFTFADADGLKPATVTIGRTFHSLLMPVRIK